MDLSIVIPTLNEARALPPLLAQLRAQRGLQLELIVADGGSTDETPARAREQGARLIAAPRGRGAQMNAGARAATGEWLLFLHADSSLASGTLLADALAALRAGGQMRIAGHFALRFARTQPGHERFYRVLEAKTRSGRRYTINGDQGLLLPAAYFRELGGYDESLPFMEDQRIAARILDTGVFRLLPGELTTSARRFESEGAIERYTLMAMSMGLHAAGAREFFQRAPQLYASQDRTAPLDLRPYAELARDVLRERGRLTTLRRAGAFARENLWQVFLWRDLARGDGRSSAQEFHDRRIAPLLDHAAGDLAAALLLAGWLYVWLPLQLRHPRRERSPD